MNFDLFDDYQKQSLTTANYKPINHACIYPALGLVSEAGEIVGKLKKIFRDKDGVFSEEDVKSIICEIGDTIWYCSVLANEFGYKLSDVAKMNVEKLKSRKDRGVIHGDGDYR